MRIACFSAGFRRFCSRSWLGCGLLTTALLASAVWAESEEPALPPPPVEAADEAPEPEAKEPAELDTEEEAEEAPVPTKVKAIRLNKQPPAIKPADKGEKDNRQLCPTTRPAERPLSDIPVTADPPDDGLKNKDGSPFMPPDCAKELIRHEGLQVANINIPRPWGEGTFCWKASGVCHRPLYFEDVVLERYGQKSIVPGLQPVISGVRFYASLAALPYKMGVEPCRKCIYTLGYYRPGDCPPRLFQRPPFEVDASLLEVGTIAGLILLLP